MWFFIRAILFIKRSVKSKFYVGFCVRFHYLHTRGSELLNLKKILPSVLKIPSFEQFPLDNQEVQNDTWISEMISWVNLPRTVEDRHLSGFFWRRRPTSVQSASDHPCSQLKWQFLQKPRRSKVIVLQVLYRFVFKSLTSHKQDIVNEMFDIQI